MLHGHGDDLYRYTDIRVNFSSNIYSHADMSALKQHLSQHLSAIDSYPEPEPRALAELIARKRGISADCVLVTNGATEAIYLIAQALSHAGVSHYYVHQPTFNEYADACRMFGMQPVDADSNPVDADSPRVDTDSPRVDAGSPRVVSWFCNPNNPTGEVYTDSTSHFSLLTSHFPLPPSHFSVLDQSYEEYTHARLLQPAEAVARGDIFQLFSLTKTYAIPGLRIGYVVAAPTLIALLRRFVRPWSVNALAIEAARWLLTHDVKAVTDLDAYLAEAQRLNRLLSAVPHIDVRPTQTNFMLARIDGATAAELKDYLAREHHILIRDASNFVGLSPSHFRVAAQTPREDDLLLSALSAFTARLS